jgi:hypothetical protein
MSPIDHIEKGIREGNWETVSEGFERLTGKAIPPPIVDVNQGAEAIYMLKLLFDQINEYFGTVTSKPAAPIKKKPGRPKWSKKKKKIAVTADGEDSSLQLNMDKRTPGRDNDIQTQMVQQKADQTRLITNEPDPEEIELNKQKAKRSNRNKLQLNRTPPQTFDVECSECEKQFESDRRSGKDGIGQKCPSCLRNTIGRCR